MTFEQLRAIQNEAEQVNRTYDLFNEDARLNRSPAAQVEFLTNCRYIQQYLRPGARILDVGAGGRHHPRFPAEAASGGRHRAGAGQRPGPVPVSRRHL